MLPGSEASDMRASSDLEMSGSMVPVIDAVDVDGRPILHTFEMTTDDQRILGPNRNHGRLHGARKKAVRHEVHTEITT